MHFYIRVTVRKLVTLYQGQIKTKVINILKYCYSGFIAHVNEMHTYTAIAHFLQIFKVP